MHIQRSLAEEGLRREVAGLRCQPVMPRVMPAAFEILPALNRVPINFFFAVEGDAANFLPVVTVPVFVLLSVEDVENVLFRFSISLRYYLEHISPRCTAVSRVVGNEAVFLSVSVAVALRTAVNRQLREFVVRHPLGTLRGVRVAGFEFEVAGDYRRPARVLVEKEAEHPVKVALEMTAIEFNQRDAETGGIAVPVVVPACECAFACGARNYSVSAHDCTANPSF
jgi:hypothetical protein